MAGRAGFNEKSHRYGREPMAMGSITFASFNVHDHFDVNGIVDECASKLNLWIASRDACGAGQMGREMVEPARTVYI